jgi:inhibitor of cysteine peptidase
MEMKKSFGILALVLAAGLLLTACSVQTITQKMDGQTISVRAGDAFIVKLAGNPTTGYSWQLADQDENIVKLDGDPEYKSDSVLVGSGGMYTYHFKAVSSGTVTLKFNYLRTWETDTAPAQTFSIIIEVQ